MKVKHVNPINSEKQQIIDTLTVHLHMFRMSDSSDVTLILKPALFTMKHFFCFKVFIKDLILFIQIVILYFSAVLVIFKLRVD